MSGGRQAKGIVFVPGKNPKPPAAQHLAQLWRCLLEGVRRADPETAGDLQRHAAAFNLISWNQLFYRTERNPDQDLPWIDALINKHGPSTSDIREAKSLRRRLAWLSYNLADLLPMVTGHIPDPSIRAAIAETRRYFENAEGIAEEIRRMLKTKLGELFEYDVKVLLIGHSLGSVIAYDALWELGHVDKQPGRIDRFLTLGSPLGMNYVQRRLLGADQDGARHYPANIREWINISAEGDLTTVDPVIENDFREMLDMGMTEKIEDHSQGVYNYFRDGEGLNLHRSYGYLVNPVTGKAIAEWWRGD